jgi:CheY-like chemotaxis protein
VKPATHRLLIIEDSNEDFEAFCRIIDQVSQTSLDIHRCVDGDEALNFLHQTSHHPDLIILDLNLPGTDGREILVIIKTTKSLKTIPIVVLSTSSNPKDIEACYQSGVNSYMLKPMNINHLKDAFRTMLDYWFKAIILPNSAKL